MMFLSHSDAWLTSVKLLAEKLFPSTRDISTCRVCSFPRPFSFQLAYHGICSLPSATTDCLGPGNSLLAGSFRHNSPQSETAYMDFAAPS